MHQLFATLQLHGRKTAQNQCFLNSSKLANTLKVRFTMASEKRRLVYPSIWRRGVESSPLRKRGWVFQERFLSPRKMHFSEDQILWECKELRLSENCPFGFGQSLFWPAKQETRDELRALGFKFSPTQLDSFDKWGEIVKNYSRTILTKDTDRLVALSGVAGAFSASRGYETSAYIAGMWRDTLELSMFWMPVVYQYERGEQLTSSHYIAPSFS
jgi:hypothetical protein